MSASYKVVIWNHNKWIYDAVLLVLIAVYIVTFLYLAPKRGVLLDDPTLHMRAFGSLAFLMLTSILCIGPLARLDTRFLPLLYNRRHFGVMTCAVALAHAQAVVGWYFAFSPTDPFVAMLSSNTSFARFAGFPFELLGILALLILLVLATTSHDFWLKFFGAPLWKALHMMVYLAYGLIVMHICLGALQGPDRMALATVTGGGAFLVIALHLMAGRKQAIADAAVANATSETFWLNAGPVAAIAEGRAVAAHLPDGSSVAIFREKNRLSAVSNACAHQNGPLSEGRILDGCITCPWHGYQYRPNDGCSPPPFTEKIATYRLKVIKGEVWVDQRANAPGTPVEPTLLDEGSQ